MCIFGFLEEEHVDYSAMILLEDIMLPYIRKFPNKVRLYKTSADGDNRLGRASRGASDK
jgi:hypothetical protein